MPSKTHYFLSKLLCGLVAGTLAYGGFVYFAPDLPLLIGTGIAVVAASGAAAAV